MQWRLTSKTSLNAVKALEIAPRYGTFSVASATTARTSTAVFAATLAFSMAPLLVPSRAGQRYASGEEETTRTTLILLCAFGSAILIRATRICDYNGGHLSRSRSREQRRPEMVVQMKSDKQASTESLALNKGPRPQGHCPFTVS